MKSSQEHISAGHNANDGNTLVLRLERNAKNLDQLRKKLCAYGCEPQTYDLFEQIESLKKGLESLSKSNTEILTILKNKKTVAKERVGAQLAEFNRLQMRVEEYMGLASTKYIPG